jgi:hypothetical protein
VEGSEGVKRPPTPFRVDEALALADDVLSRPPARSHIERPVKRGELVARFALPLELCKPMNRVATKGAQNAGWRLGKMKSDALLLMLSQHGRRREPLPGRPQVLCLRISSSRPDPFSNWQKNAVDRLRADSRGLGFIRDDRGDFIDERAWWEPGPRSGGCVVIEVRSEA